MPVPCKRRMSRLSCRRRRYVRHVLPGAVRPGWRDRARHASLPADTGAPFNIYHIRALAKALRARRPRPLTWIAVLSSLASSRSTLPTGLLSFRGDRWATVLHLAEFPALIRKSNRLVALRSKTLLSGGGRSRRPPQIFPELASRVRSLLRNTEVDRYPRAHRGRFTGSFRRLAEPRRRCRRPPVRAEPAAGADRPGSPPGRGGGRPRWGPGPDKRGDRGRRLTRGGSSAAVGMAANPFGAHRAGRHRVGCGGGRSAAAPVEEPTGSNRS